MSGTHLSQSVRIQVFLLFPDHHVKIDTQFSAADLKFTQNKEIMKAWDYTIRNFGIAMLVFLMHNVGHGQSAAQDKAKEVLIRAIDKIDLNYNRNSHAIYGDYSEDIFGDKELTDEYYQLSAKVLAERSGYGMKGKKENVRLSNISVTRGWRYNELWANIYAGPHIVNLYDFVKLRMGPLQKETISSYQITLGDTLCLDGGDVVLLEFTRHDCKGRLTISLKDYSIKSGYFELLGDDLKHKGFLRESRKFHTQYSKVGSYYQLSSVEYSTIISKGGVARNNLIATRQTFKAIQDIPQTTSSMKKVAFRDVLVKGGD